MGKNEVIKIISGIAFIFITITEIFAILSMVLPLLVGGTIKENLSLLASYAWPQLVVIATIIILLLYNRKQNWSISILLHDRNIRLSAGTLLAIDGLVDLFDRMPPLISIINFYFQHPEPISLSNSTIFNILSLSMANIFVLCQIAIGIYLFKYFKTKLSDAQDIPVERNEAIKTSTGIALLFFLVIDVRNVVNRIISRFIKPDYSDWSIFAKYDLPWLIATAAIIILLFIFVKKQNWSIRDFLEDSIVRKTAGVLIVIDAIFSLAICLSEIIAKTSAYAQVQQYSEFEKMLTLSIVANVINLVLVLCQIVIGINMIRHYRCCSVSQ